MYNKLFLFLISGKWVSDTIGSSILIPCVWIYYKHVLYLKLLTEVSKEEKLAGCISIFSLAGWWGLFSRPSTHQGQGTEENGKTLLGWTRRKVQTGLASSSKARALGVTVFHSIRLRNGTWGHCVKVCWLREGPVWVIMDSEFFVRISEVFVCFVLMDFSPYKPCVKSWLSVNHNEGAAQLCVSQRQVISEWCSPGSPQT